MAGNIVPAIASTNAVVGGIIVMEALNIISSNLNQCKSVSIQLIAWMTIIITACIIIDLFEMST